MGNKAKEDEMSWECSRHLKIRNIYQHAIRTPERNSKL
jgi:hypothetical protein